MDEPPNTKHEWRIDFTDQRLAAAAQSVAEEVGAAGVPVASPNLEPPKTGTLGTPEIIITIVVTTVGKALIDAGLEALRKALEDYLDRPDASRAQVVLSMPDNSKQRFPIDLRKAGKAFVDTFISQIKSTVDKT